MVGSDEAYRDLTVFISPAAEVLFCIDVTEILRDVVVEDLRIVLLDDSCECR